MRILSLFVWINGCLALLVPQSLVAQVVPDQTLGSIATSPNQSQIVITGGTIADRNLFHSFDRFSLNAGQTAVFSPDPAIANIITRITGTEASRIDGTIAVNGNANLFLINPKGIFFGQTASLAIHGSFLATTAPGLRFADGTILSTHPSEPPLLTISAPIGVVQPVAPITNAGNLSAGRDLTIAGLDISGSGQFTAGNQLSITANTLTLNQAQISSGSEGTNIAVQNAIVLTGGQIESASGGAIHIEARSMSLLDGATINTSISSGRSGDISLDIQDGLTIKSTIDAPPSGITSVMNEQGTGGNITVKSGSFQMFGGSQILTMLNGTGNGGSIDIRSNHIELAGTNGRPPEIASTVTEEGIGTAGNIRVAARTLSLTNRAKITALTLGQAASGDITLNADDRISVEGTKEIFPWLGLVSSLFSAPTVQIENNVFRTRTRSLFSARAVINASNSQTGVLVSSFTPFQTGSLSIAAPDIQFTHQALFAINNWGSGNSGDLRLTARRLTMQDSAIFVSTISGKGGDLVINTPRLKLDRGVIVSATAQGQGGNMTLNVPELLLLRFNSRIATRGFNTVDSGNIDINAGLIVAKPIENSVIIANAVSGRGGTIQINARSLFGIAFDQTLASSSSPSSINAGSQFGLSGEVKLNVLQPSPGSEVVKLPTEIIDASTQIDQTCSSQSTMNRFIRTGRGGIAPDLAESNRSTPVWEDRRNSHSTAVQIEETQIVEATGWTKNSAGQIVLVSDGSTAPMNSSIACKP